MRHLNSALSRYRVLADRQDNDETRDDDLLLLEDAESDLSSLLRTLAEVVPYVDVEDPRDDEFTMYRRRDLARRLRRLV